MKMTLIAAVALVSAIAIPAFAADTFYLVRDTEPYMRALEFPIALGFAIATSAGLLWVIWLMLSGSFP
jgi:hypothetical protein